MSKKTTRARLNHTPLHRLHHGAAWMIVGAWAVVGILTGVFLINRGTLSQFGSKASFGKASLRVTNVQFDAQGSMPYLAPPGLKFVIVTVEVENGAQDIFDFAPVLQSKVIDESGRSWPMSPAMMAKPIQAGPFPTSAKRIGTLSYLVPAATDRMTFEFDPLSPLGQASQYILATQ